MPAADAAAPADTYAAMIGLGYLNDMPSGPTRRAATLWTPCRSPRDAPAARAARRDLQRNRPGPQRLSSQWRQDHHLSRLGGPGDSAFRDRRLLPGRRETGGGLPAAQSFSRLYFIPGLYHCPCGQKVDGDPATTVEFMPDLVAWVEHGQAPGSITLPVTAQTTGAPLTSLSIEPFDPLKPAPENNGLTATTATSARRATTGQARSCGAPIGANS